MSAETLSATELQTSSRPLSPLSASRPQFSPEKNVFITRRIVITRRIRVTYIYTSIGGYVSISNCENASSKGVRTRMLFLNRCFTVDKVCIARRPDDVCHPILYGRNAPVFGPVRCYDAIIIVHEFLNSIFPTVI